MMTIFIRQQKHLGSTCNAVPAWSLYCTGYADKILTLSSYIGIPVKGIPSGSMILFKITW